MIRTSYLRVYEPLARFPAHERSLWASQSSEDDGLEVLASRKWLITAALPGRDPSSTLDERAFIRNIDGRVLVCPWRTRLRMLTSLLAFRGVVPDEVADAFVPEMEAQRAARELATMDEETPEVRSHILHANWHVPLRWFGAFEDTERILVEDRSGLRLRYETPTMDARSRLNHTLLILEDQRSTRESPTRSGSFSTGCRCSRTRGSSSSTTAASPGCSTTKNYSKTAPPASFGNAWKPWSRATPPGRAASSPPSPTAGAR